MATVYYTGNAQTIAQLDTLLVTAVAVGGTLSAVINGKSITYTCVTGDTVATAATGWFNLLSNSSTAPAEFNEQSWANPSDGVVTATGPNDGTPFTMTKAQAGGATCTLTHTTAASSPNDVGLAANWLRSGVAAIPQNGDDGIYADTTASILWNLTALAAVQFASWTDWMSATGTVGLPENNPNGYLEYRPTYFQFLGPPGGTLAFTLGVGNVGSGSGRQRYDVQGQRTAFVVQNAGGAIDTYAVRLKGTNVNNTLALTNTSVGIAMLPAEVSTIASAQVAQGGILALGVGATFSGALTVNGGQVTLFCAPASVVIDQGAQLIVGEDSLTYAAITARGGSRVTWISNSTITTLVLQTGSTFDKSQSTRAMTVTNSTVDGDTCLINDPLNTITYTNATTVNNRVSSGPFAFGTGRTVKIV